MITLGRTVQANCWWSLQLHFAVCSCCYIVFATHCYEMVQDMWAFNIYAKKLTSNQLSLTQQGCLMIDTCVHYKLICMMHFVHPKTAGSDTYYSFW